MAFFLLQDICCLIVSNCSFYVCRIISDNIISMDVDFSSVNFGGSLLPAGNTVVGIEYFDVAVPEVICVTIDETVINARTGKVFDAISGMDVCLHSVFCDKKVISAAHDGMIGVIEQIVCIKCQDISGRQIVGEEIALQVNGGLYIEAIVFKIDEGNPFSET